MKFERPLAVLVVDDEKIIADTLVMILTRAGFKARAAYGGDEAVEMASDLQPDILVSDVIMDGINGIEVAIQITRSQPSCKVLLFSGQASSADLLRESELHGYEFELILKPIHPTELIHRLQEFTSTRDAETAC